MLLSVISFVMGSSFFMHIHILDLHLMPCLLFVSNTSILSSKPAYYVLIRHAISSVSVCIDWEFENKIVSSWCLVMSAGK